MLRDITIGQYYDVESVVHKLDPRTKIIATVVYIISLFCVKNILGFLLAGIGLLAAVKLARIPLRFILRGLKTVMVLLIIMESTTCSRPKGMPRTPTKPFVPPTWSWIPSGYRAVLPKSSLSCIA